MVAGHDGTDVTFSALDAARAGVIHRLELVADELRGEVELVLPESGAVRYSAVFSGSAVGAGYVVVLDDAVPRPRGRALEVRTDGLWTEMTCETRDEHWSFGLEAFGLRVDDPQETIGDRIAVGYDLEWETPDLVHGELLLARAVIPVDARGTFTVT
jgi:hypothetical protein